jgi:DNA polymerase-4
VRSLLAAAAPLIETAGLTLVGISIANLDDEDIRQLELPFEPRGPRLVDAALDDIHDRFGSKAITRAVLLGHDPGLTVPLLPD